MRVVAGSAKGTILKKVPGSGTRPILDRVKTALFDKLQYEITDALFLDLFAGSGSVGIEALSRGASFCTFVDAGSEAIHTVRENLTRCRLVERAEVFKKDAFKFMTAVSCGYNFIYVAPPQYKGLWQRALATIEQRPSALAPAGRIVVQIDPKEYELFQGKLLVEQEQRRYGNTLLVFYRTVENE